MDLFGQLVRTVVNVAAIPVDLAVDTVSVFADAADGRGVAPRTRERIQQLKDEASDAK